MAAGRLYSVFVCSRWSEQHVHELFTQVHGEQAAFKDLNKC